MHTHERTNSEFLTLSLFLIHTDTSELLSIPVYLQWSVDRTNWAPLPLCAAVFVCVCVHACASFKPSRGCVDVWMCACARAFSHLSVSVFDRSRWMASLWSLSPTASLSVGLRSTTNHQVLTQTPTSGPEEDRAKLHPHRGSGHAQSEAVRMMCFSEKNPKKKSVDSLQMVTLVKSWVS